MDKLLDKIDNNKALEWCELKQACLKGSLPNNKVDHKERMTNLA